MQREGYDVLGYAIRKLCDGVRAGGASEEDSGECRVYVRRVLPILGGKCYEGYYGK